MTIEGESETRFPRPIRDPINEHVSHVSLVGAARIVPPLMRKLTLVSYSRFLIGCSFTCSIHIRTAPSTGKRISKFTG